MSDQKQIPLAIVGMACRLPGADDLDQLWRMLIEGRCAVGDLPADRFDADLYYDPRKGIGNKSYTRRGAVVTNRRFPNEFPISPAMANKADSTHWMMCQVAAEAVRHAGMDPLNVPDRNTGVFVGHTIGSERNGDLDYAAAVPEVASMLSQTGSFQQLASADQQRILRRLVDTVRAEAPRAVKREFLASNMAARLIAKSFGLHGPCMTVNAACASSLQALMISARALQRGTIDMAVVGGASVCHRDWLVLFSSAQSLSANASRPFDQNADGLMVAEGYVGLVIKTLDRALADGDPIQAIIRGLGTSCDGRGKSLWAPRREGQVEAIRRAYASPQEMAGVQYVEAHATGTRLGDATEIASITEAFAAVSNPQRKMAITSLKANVGHLLEAAGLAGVVKSVLCMQRGMIPRAACLEQLSDQIDWNRAPVYVPLENTRWPEPQAGRPRRAAVNAFGIGGLNMHVVLDAYETNGPISLSGSLAPDILASTTSISRHRDETAIAVIGVGCVLAGVRDWASFLEQTRSGFKQTRETQTQADLSYRAVEGFEYDWKRHRIPPRQIQFADPLQFMALDAAEQSLKDAGYTVETLDRRMTGVIAGTEFQGDFLTRLHLLLRLPRLAKTLREILAAESISEQSADTIVAALEQQIQTRWPMLSDETGSFSASSLAVRIAKTWDLMGGGAALDSGCTSGLAALAAARDMLVCHDSNLMICVGAQRDLLPATIAPAASLQTVTKGPFDRDANGSVPGEGAVVLLLKRLSDARRDGNKVRAVIRDIRSVHGEPGQAIRDSIRACIETNGGPSVDLGFVVSGAVGGRQDDEYTSLAIDDSLVRDANRPPIPLTSMVGQVGHTGGASSLVSLITAIAAFQNRTVPPVSGLQNVMPRAGGRHVQAVCPGTSVPLPRPSETPILSAVIGHGKGLATTVLVEEPPIAQRTPFSAAAHSVVVNASEPAHVAGGVLVDRAVGPQPLDLKSKTSEHRVAHRSVLRLTDAPPQQPASTPFQIAGAVLIIGTNEPGQVLGNQLRAQGAVVHQLPADEGGHNLASVVEMLPTEPPVRHVFVMSLLDDACKKPLDLGTWSVQRMTAIELPFVALQGWVKYLQKHDVQGRLTVSAVTRMGGDLGLGDQIPSPLGGWIAGTLKSLRVELKRNDRPAVAKVCDFGPTDTPERIANATLQELASGEDDIEVALGRNRRRVIRSIEQPVDGLPVHELHSGGAWVITGGARGITAEVALALGKKYNLTMHLVGRSPAPQPDAPWRDCSEEQLKTIKRSIVRQAISEKKSPEKQWERVKTDIEIHKNIQRMLDLGLNVTYHSCDVADLGAVGRLLDTVRQRSGPVTGIIHGAGYARTSRFEMQKRDELDKTIGAKVDGAVALMLLTQNDPLRYFVGFGSISGRFGGNGLSDYAAANDMLAKLCAWHRILRPSCATTCIDWQSWDEVGMAMLPDSTVGTRGVLKMKFLPPSEGIEHLDRELRAGLPECEVLIDDGEFATML